MNTAVVSQAKTIFNSLGEIKSRSMFGGFGIFCNETMFALVVNGKLHVRSNEENLKLFKNIIVQPYQYVKKGFPVITNYYEIEESLWDNQAELINIGKNALDISIAAQKEKEKLNAAPSRIKDLPNLRLATERLLKRAGIDSVKKLQMHGSLEAFKELRRTHSRNMSLDMLWALEGALTGIHSSVISEQRRNELLQGLSN